MGELYLIDKKDLYKHYILDDKTVGVISRLYNCSEWVVFDRLSKFNIRKRKNLNKFLTKEVLYEEYIIKDKSICKIAEEVGCTTDSVLKRLHKFDIKKERFPAIKFLTKGYLYKNYSIIGKSKVNIAKELNCGEKLVNTAINRYKIKSKLQILKEKLTKSILKEFYIDKKLSKQKIANKFNCNRGMIANLLSLYKIKIRTMSECHSGELATWYGKKMSKVVRQKMSKNRIGVFAGKKNPMYGVRLIGKLNPNYKDGRSLVIKYCPDCGKQLKNWHSTFCASCAKKGERGPNWHNGLSNLPYPLNFNESLKEKIRERDCRVCKVCGIIENGRHLHVHHIDYNKENLDSSNLVSLCGKCHQKTNHNRDYWFAYFRYIMDGE
jgi:predicted DNA-binding protein YlxM (UPF0122 family)